MERKEQFEELKKAYAVMLDIIRPGWRRDAELFKTPERAALAVLEIVQGQFIDFNQGNCTLFTNPNKDKSQCLVEVKDMQFHSLCEHHLLPFFGTASIIYAPGNLMLGISKLPRILHKFASRATCQEKIASEVIEFLGTLGFESRVEIEATHLCMCARGIRSQGVTKTISESPLFQIKRKL